MYVIELQLEKPPEDGTGAVYVGQSWHPPELRFQQHQQGLRAARIVRTSGVRLVPRLSKGWGPYATREESLRAETALAAALRKKGYRVYGGH